MTNIDPCEINDLLRDLHYADPSYRVFGSRKHRYGLNPPLAESSVDAFERQHGITLPADYRAFLCEIADGGAGPYYGLATLRAASEDRDLGIPFPFIESTEGMSCERVKVKATGYHQYEEFGGSVGGILEVSHRGCVIYACLVVRGPAFGTMWEIREDCYPMGITFGQWYHRWMLDMRKRALPLLKAERQITGIKVGMTQAEIVAICGGHPKERKLYRSIHLRFPHLRTEFELDQKRVLRRIIDYDI
jgi:hypothetical protein